MQDWHILCKCEGPTPPPNLLPLAFWWDLGADVWGLWGEARYSGRWNKEDYSSRFLGWAGSIWRVRGMPEVWPLALGSCLGPFAVGDGPRAVD